MRLEDLKFFFYSNLMSIIELILNLIPRWVQFCIIKSEQVNILIKKENLKNIIKFMKYFNYIYLKSLIDIAIVDYPGNNYRFKIVYNFISYLYNLRILVNLFSKEFEKIYSLMYIFPSSVWSERESWDLFGIIFVNNIDLRRILTDYGFFGFPLRKDFPLSGYVELFYNEKNKIVEYNPIELTQELRFFHFNSSWEDWNIN